MKQFDLEEYKKNPGRKVVTRDGRIVRIVCWDLPGNHPIIGITDETDDGYTTLNLTVDGTSVNNKNLDLFFADEEEELTEFEEQLASILFDREYEGKTDTEDDIERGMSPYRLAAKEYSRELLEFAKEELKTQLRFSSDMHGWEYGLGYEQGQKDILKDLPKLTKIKPSDDKIYVGLNGWYITEEDLMKLSKKE